MTRIFDGRLQTLWTTMQAYRRLDGPGWPVLDLVGVVPSAEVLDPDAAAILIATQMQHSGRNGWVRFRSAAIRFGSEAERSFDATSAGVPIAGEWVLDGHRSLHLRPDPQSPGRLVAYRYAERPLGAGDMLLADEIPALRQSVRVLAHPGPARPPARGDSQLVLSYHVFWGTDEGEEPHALRRLFSRFVGFAHEDLIVRATDREDRIVRAKDRKAATEVETGT
jgi:hypothetical protein